MKPTGYTRPVWIMCGLTAATCMVTILSLYLRTNDGIRRIHYFDFLPFVFLAETLVYWFIRKKAGPSWSTTLHIILSIAAFFFQWLLIPVLILMNHDRLGSFTQRAVLYYEQRLLSITVIVVANLFFIVTIVKSFSKKNVPVHDVITDPADSFPG